MHAPGSAAAVSSMPTQPGSVWSGAPGGGPMATMLIVDDELDMRMLVRVVIEMANDGLSLVGEAADGHAAIRVWRDLDGRLEEHTLELQSLMPMSYAAFCLINKTIYLHIEA